MQGMDSPSDGPYFIGVDVGTGSARAALVNKRGDIISVATQALQILEPESEFYEQSSDDIWNAVCLVVKSVCANVDKNHIKGIGFDATCSLVVLDGDYRPLSVNKLGDSRWNVIMWMDHRAKEQAAAINETNHKVLDYVGGCISLEMEIPKLLWLKQNLRKDCWDKAGHFFDLPDFLTWKSTSSLQRSLCSLVCKWTYLAGIDGHSGWSDDFLQLIGLEDLLESSHAKIGQEVKAPGDPCGNGLSEDAARDLGLNPGITVGTSAIDAHAGTIGCLGCTAPVSELPIPLSSKMGMICGTSTCHMTLNENSIFVPGVWGPYYSAVIPGLWTNEAGQTAAGKLIDHIVMGHASYDWIKEDADSKNSHPHSVLNGVVEYITKRENMKSSAELTRELHVWPDFHGNRSPLADPTLKGMISGLTLSTDGSKVEELAVLYYAVIQALAYGTKHILDELKSKGCDIQAIYACGGLSKNKLYIQTHADVTGLPVVVPHSSDAVLLGASILGACASGYFKTIQEAMNAMGGSGDVIFPNADTQGYHSKKYKVFRKMVEHQKEYREIMNS